MQRVAKEWEEKMQPVLWERVGRGGGGGGVRFHAIVSISSVEIWSKSLVVEALHPGGGAAKISKICMFLISR